MQIEQMIPYTTLHAFQDEDMLPDPFIPHLFQTYEDSADSATIDLDTLFPDDQLEKAEYVEDIDDNIHYGDTADNDYMATKKSGYQSCKSGYIQDFKRDSYINECLPLKKYLYQNCKWTGCDAECAKTHFADITSDPFSDLLDHAKVVVPSHCFGDDNSCDERYVTEVVSVQPYTPESDHCYYQPHPKSVETDRTIQNSVDSESTSETSDDEVDVVTVTEEYVRPVPRHVEKPYTAPKRKYTSRKNSRTRNACSVSVKAAATALKRSRYHQSKIPAKRRKSINSVETSPSSSLPSSCDNSRCSSDMEDYEKRSTHNDSERKRREAQRTALQMLRICIPDLQSNTKAPKVLILNTATNLVKKLETEAVKKKEQLKIELKKKKRLLERLKRLTTV